MKKIYLTLLLVGSVFTASAQNGDTPERKRAAADELFERYEFVDAAEQYKKLVRGRQVDYTLFMRLADCYYNLFNSVESAKWYAKAIELNPELDAETYYKYAQMLKASGRYEASNKAMKKFADMMPDDSRAVEFLKDPDYIPNLRQQEALFTFVDSGINNSQYSDFGGVLTTSNVFYFASARNEKGKKYGWNDQPYLDIYQAKFDLEEEEFKDIEPVAKLNEKYHDGPVTVTADEKTMYFASESFRKNQYELDEEKRLKKGKVSVYRATSNGKNWGKIESLPFNSGEYHVSNPSVTPDGKMLYFASDMPGGYGGMDIWRVAVNEDGTYGVPENLGDKVNTEGRETFPFICEDGKLYFASDALKGFGGLDIYRIDLKSPGTKAINLGDPINTSKDDFAMSFYPEKNIGFLSTNRVGRDDIYKVKPICVNEFEITVTDKKTGEKLRDAKVAILDHKGNVVETRFTDGYGIVRYDVDCERNYTLQVDKKDYAGVSLEMERTSNGRHPIDVALRPVELIIIEDRITLGDVYFEFDRSNITQQAAFELNKVVDIMNRNPNMRIKIESHTDSKGTEAYNLALSKRRAQSTLQYILSKGISRDRLEAEGYGENMPKVNCGDNCTEEQHAINRRSEFIILQR